MSQPQLPPELGDCLKRALQARLHLLDPQHQGGLRLFNGFYEGWPELAVDLYASTLLLHNYARPPEAASSWLPGVQAYYLDQLPWLRCVIVKDRHARRVNAGRDTADSWHLTAQPHPAESAAPPASDPAATQPSPHPPSRHGRIIYGSEPDQRLLEEGVWYALDLLTFRDASFYFDTRPLRQWAKAQLRGKRVLNAFAYTGSLGLAALAGGASQVIQLDRDRRALQLAKRSYRLNGFHPAPSDFMEMDFFPAVSRLKRSHHLFDCVFLDPPFFSVTSSGRVDLLNQGQRLINKLRPLVAHEGWLVAVNNALYLSGQDYLKMLEDLAADGYLQVERFIDVPQDITGYAQTVQALPPADPAPFNHPTKIAVLRLTRKKQE